MPKNFRYARRKQTGVRKRTSRRGGGGGGWRNITAGQAYSYAKRGIKYIKGLVNSEMYKFDTTDVGVNMTSSSAYSANLSSLVVGDADNNRTGNSVLAKCLSVRGTMVAATTANPFNIRVVIVRDNQQIADTAPVYTDVFEGSTVYSFLKKSTVGRFTILYQRNINLSTSVNPTFNLNVNIPMQHHIRYNGTAGTDIQKGGIYIMWLCDSPGGLNGNPVANYTARLSYHDN